MLRMFINLDNSRERLKSISEQLEKTGLKFERISGVDGRSLSSEKIESLIYPNDHFETKIRFTRDLTLGEIGCFLSHKKCWKKLVNSDEEWGLILEDDVVVSDRAKTYWYNEDWIPKEVKLLHMEAYSEDREGLIDPRFKLAVNDGVLVKQLRPIPLGAFCYLISKEAAIEAIKTSERLPAPVDDFLFSPWFYLEKKYPVWNLYPGLVKPSEFESDIGSREKRDIRKAPFFIRHGLSRLIMDMKIKKKQRKGITFLFRYK